MAVGILISVVIIGLVVGIGILFNNKIVKNLDKFEDYEEKGWR